MRRRSLALLLAALVGTAVSHAAGPAERWWAHVQFLAGDALEGRDTGSPGHRKAAEYVAARLQGGWPRAGRHQRLLSADRVRVAAVRRGAIPARAGAGRQGRRLSRWAIDAIVSVRVRPAPQIDAPLTFVGLRAEPARGGLRRPGRPRPEGTNRRRAGGRPRGAQRPPALLRSLGALGRPAAGGRDWRGHDPADERHPLGSRNAAPPRAGEGADGRLARRHPGAADRADGEPCQRPNDGSPARVTRLPTCWRWRRNASLSPASPWRGNCAGR